MNSKGRTIALVALFLVLLGAVAYVYWDDVFPKKLKPEDIGVQPAPAEPAQPGQPKPDDTPPPAAPGSPGSYSG